MDHDRRRIRGAAVISNPIIQTHPILQFAHRDITAGERLRYRERLAANIDQTIIASDALDWGFTDQIVQPDTMATGSDTLRELLSVSHTLDDGSIGFVSYAWIRLFSIVEYIFKELVVEFYSSVYFDVRDDDVCQHTLRFVLGGVPRALSLVEFAQAVGLYEADEEANPHFRDFLRAGRRDPYSDIEVALGWTDIANGDFGERSPSDVHVRSPVHRLVHRLLSHSIVARKTGLEKVHKPDLFYLHMITQGRNVNVPWRLASWMAHKATGSRAMSVICGGQYVTRIARWLGVTIEMLHSCTVVSPGMQLMGEHQLLELDVVRRTLYGDRYISAPSLAPRCGG